jgi:hypothetical protein
VGALLECARGDHVGRFGLFQGTELGFCDKTVLGSTEGGQVGYSEGIEEGI